jgi:broad specificity phosphatase PhoE
VTGLFLLRHGPTAWNAVKRVQGRADIPLSAHGRATVATWRLPAEVADWRAVTSPLSRAVETARLLGLAAEPEPALIEMDWGEWEGSRLTDAERMAPAELTQRAEAGLDFRPPGGESYRDVQERLRSFLAGCAATGHPTLAVAHQGVILALLALATGWTMRDPPPLRLRPGHGQVFDLMPDGRPTVRTLNVALAADRAEERE